MKRIFFDTNIVVDILTNCMPFYEDACTIVDYAVENNIDIFVSTTSVITAVNLTSQMGLDRSKALDTVFSLFTIVDTSGSAIRHAMELNWDNFENAVQYAVAYRERAEYFITRNQAGIKPLGLVKVVSLSEFINILIG